MSIENLKEYARRCAADPDLRDKAKSIGATNVPGQIEHAESMGLHWTASDLVEFQKEMQAEGELSEEDLEQVAGGLVTTTAALVGSAVVGAAAGAVAAGAAVTSTTSGGGW
jgi:predicted ribosomally synthesized peptide with nif11-like leader